MKYINDIPVFLVNVDDSECTITTMSLVDAPAMSIDMVTFSEQKEQNMKFSIQDEAKRNILTCLVRVDFPILRLTDDGSPFYIIFNRESARKLAQRLMSDGYQQNVSLDHNGKLIDGVILQEVFIKDTSLGINPVGFEEAAEGSLMAILHIEDDDLWNECLEGRFKGISIETYLGLQAFKKVEKKDTTINTNTNSMQKIQMFKTLLKDLLMSFNSLSTNKEELYWNEDTELMVGYDVFTEDERGNKVPAPDGEYVSDNNVIVVVDGKVTEIKEKEEKPEVEPEPVVEEPDQEPVNMEQEPEQEPVVEETPVETPEEKDDIKEKIAELEARIADLEKRISDLESKIIEISTSPAADPIVDEFEQVTKTVSTGDKKLDKRIAIARALRD